MVGSMHESSDGNEFFQPSSRRRFMGRAAAGLPDPVRDFLLTYTSAATLTSDRSSALLCCQALGRAYRLVASGADSATAIEEVRPLLGSSPLLNADSFRDLQQMLVTQQHIETMLDDYAHYAGNFLKTAATLTGLVNKPAGVALGIAGIWAEDGLKFIGKSGGDLRYLTLAETRREDMNALFGAYVAAANGRSPKERHLEGRNNKRPDQSALRYRTR